MKDKKNKIFWQKKRVRINGVVVFGMLGHYQETKSEKKKKRKKDHEI